MNVFTEPRQHQELESIDTGDAGAPSAPASSGASRANILLALLAVYIIWGSTYLGIRIAIETIPPFMMAGVRFLIAGALLYGFARLRRAPNPNRKQWVGAAILGFLLLVCGNGFVTYAEKWISSGLAALVVGTMPLWAALWAGLFGHWPRKLEWAGLALGFVGVVLLNLESDLQANGLATLVLFLSPVCWSLGSVLSQRLTAPSGLMASASEMLIGGAALMIVSLASGEKLTVQPSAGSLLAMGYLVLFGSIVAFSAYLFLLDNVRPTLATSYAYVNPAVAVGLGVGLAGEQITGAGVVAMLAILTAVVIISLASTSSKA